MVERANGASRVILFCLILLLVLCFSIHKVENRDFGWQLKTGEYIYENHRAPKAELFSFTAQGNKYIDSHWLFQLLLFVSYRLLGIPGPTLLMAGIALAVFTLVYLVEYDKRKYAVASVLVFAGIVMASERLIVRPHLMTVFFLSVYFFILERHRRKRSRMIFLLPLFQVLWVNMHGLFVLGLILPGIYLGCGFIESKVRLPWVRQGMSDGLRGKDFGIIAAILAVMVCESFLSPYTVDIALYPVTLFKEVQSGANVVATGVSELAPTLGFADLSRSERYFKWMVYLLPLTFLLNIRRLNLAHASLFAAFLYLGLIARRNLDLFAVVAIPIAIANVNGFTDYLLERFARKNAARTFAAAQLVLSPLIMAGIIYTISGIVTNRYYIEDRDLTRFGFGVAKFSYPIKAANFVEAAGLGGRMFNDPSFGGYLIWRFYPERRVYYDGRWEVYGDRFFENFKRVCSAPALLDEQAEALDIRYAILPHSLGHLRRVLKHMTESSGWELVYFDEVSTVFVRNVPENAEVIRRYAVDPATFERKREEYDARLPADIARLPFGGTNSALLRLAERVPKWDYPFEEIARANFYFSFGHYDNARLLYERALRIYPDSEIAHGRLGTIYWRMQLPEFAVAEFEAVEQLNPRDAVNLMNLGNLNFAMGRLDKAEEYFKRVKRLQRDNAAASLQLGKVYAQEGRNEKAVRELRRALKLDPELREARELLRRVE